MQIFATFEHSIYVELALSSLASIDIQKQNILAVPLDNRKEDRKLFDTLHRSDGVSLFDKGAALAVAFSVVAASMGFEWEWGPIFWGLIGAAAGFLLGFTIDLLLIKFFHKRKRVLKGKKSEVLLVIECLPEQMGKVETILWDHLALGVAKIEETH
ncbi:hypothetical protein [Natribacillus halophilus]|uniref:Uncharacterized protein n=1 Tax=Natribacillus halophilus TaxID=549003 RepID=A0A1G8KRD3_9BACI|nr:hypothetical protein [Natribacillus halophilus]SDI46035.1 hypothetical protein SAMN04488123_102264 [Natribacillus halophilus]